MTIRQFIFLSMVYVGLFSFSPAYAAERRPLNPNEMSIPEMVEIMAEGDVRVAQVLVEMAKDNPEWFVTGLLCLEDMNIRGSQIWAAYHDFAHENITDFQIAIGDRMVIGDRDPQMVDVINSVMGPDYGFKAVVSGASPFMSPSR